MTSEPQPTIPEITRTDCARCGTEVHGLAGRYACALCGWVNHYSEGHEELPGLDADPDHGRERRR
ncbi:hypothetical protein [Streptomyces sp. NPDC013181]|uniref:hypothetical protein n=1 Tax=Streptomyces sp. NPDC013181 TaxID=3364864 RepID=UPI0036A77F04